MAIKLNKVKFIDKKGNVSKHIEFFSNKLEFPLGVLRLHFRNRNFTYKLSTLRRIYKRAKLLENNLPIQAKYADILQKVKDAVYRPRYDLDRDITTIVYRIVEQFQDVTLPYAWDLLLNGEGLAKNPNKFKHIKRITCIEKRVKCLRLFNVFLAKQFA